MRYAIFENGKEINVIEADEAFVTDYCEQNGYMYQEAPLPAPESEQEPEEDSSVWDGKELPPGKWIGDQYNSEAALAARLDAAEASAAELSEALELILSGATEDTEVTTDEA